MLACIFLLYLYLFCFIIIYNSCSLIKPKCKFLIDISYIIKSIKTPRLTHIPSRESHAHDNSYQQYNNDALLLFRCAAHKYSLF